VTPEDVARRVVLSGTAPACSAGYAVRIDQWQTETGGNVDIFFDLASLTKPMTAVAIACAGLDRTERLGAFLAEARGTPSEDVSLELLLSHRAGLEAHHPLYASLLEGRPGSLREMLRTAASARRPDASGSPPIEGFPPLYSDLGYLLAGEALARSTTNRDAGDAIRSLVLEPMGLGDRLGTIRDLSERGVAARYAPTEDVVWRGGRLQGQVHDDNAWALNGLGGSGHAGMFGTAEGVLLFAAGVLDSLERRSGPLARVDLRWLVEPRAGGTLRAGFDGKDAKDSSAGSEASPHSFGHLGFVGTSFWIDPEARIISTLLTNRVFVGRHHQLIRQARPWAHDALWREAASKMSGVSP
jgi:CubicO group peptidase (beta-lactamase class C family)